MKNKIKKELHKLKKTGFFSIFLSSILSKVIVFIGGVILVRILSKSDYGIYSYILNAISFLCIFNDFGASNAALQFLTEYSADKDKQKAVLKYSLKVGIRGALFSSILVLISPIFYPFTESVSKELTPMLFLIPFINTLNSFITVILRANMQNKKYGILQIITTAAHYIFLIPFTLLFGLVGAVLSQYFYTGVILLFGLYLIKDIISKNKNIKLLDKKEQKDFLKLSFATQVNNSVGSLLIILDTFLIGVLMIDMEAVASYKVASGIPKIMSFLPSILTVYILPYFIKHNKDTKWIEKNYNKVMLYCLLFFGSIISVLLVFSKFIIKFMYGSQYLDAVPAFCILIIGYFFSSSIKIPSSNIIYSMRKVKINLIVTIISGILKVALNVILIPTYGIIGAASSTMIINILDSGIFYIYLKIMLKKRKKEENV